MKMGGLLVWPHLSFLCLADGNNSHAETTESPIKPTAAIASVGWRLVITNKSSLNG